MGCYGANTGIVLERRLFAHGIMDFLYLGWRGNHIYWGNGPGRNCERENKLKVPIRSTS